MQFQAKNTLKSNHLYNTQHYLNYFFIKLKRKSIKSLRLCKT